MGCKQSTEKKPIPQKKPVKQEAEKGSTNANAPSATTSSTAPAPAKDADAINEARQKAIENTMRVILEGAEEAINEQNASQEEKAALAVAFLNSVVDGIKMQYKVKKELSIQLVTDICEKSKLTTLQGSVSGINDQMRDEFFVRVVRSWCSSVKTNEKTISRDVLAADKLHTALLIERFPEQCSFYLIMSKLLHLADDPAITQLFDQYSGGETVMTAANLFRFLKEGQQVDAATMKAAEDKLRDRFGGSMTKFSFALYISSQLFNNAHDPVHVSNVWHNMTQPLPNYLFHTEIVESVTELQAALSRSARAVVLHCRDEGGKVYAGESLLEDMLVIIRNEAFKLTMYPLVICLAPEAALTLELQDSVANLLTSVLNKDVEMIAKGIMFHGATLSDPQFSPAALQKKVLIMASQAPLKPFVGFHVADMHRAGLGVRVTNVQSGTPAANAGIEKDDWLTHINGAPIESRNQLKERLRTLRLGEEVVLKKENLEEVKVVVGGTVESNTPEISKKLSDLVFLRINHHGVDDSTAEPWDILTLNTLNKEDTIADRRRSLTTHFNFLALNGSSPKETAGGAVEQGVQFVCATRAPEDQIWVRGLFAENAHCGYLNKNEISNDIIDVRIVLVTPPERFRGIPITAINCRMYGTGTCTHSDDLTVIDVKGAAAFSVAAFTITFGEGKEAQSTTVSFPPAIVRAGHRVFSAVASADEGGYQKWQADSILVSIEVHKEQAVMLTSPVSQLPPITAATATGLVHSYNK